MNKPIQFGLGELARHFTVLLDRGAEQVYRAKGLRYRPRYTPLMRALSEGPCTISEMTLRARITQGAVSQTVKLMEEEGLIARRAGQDARQITVSLTEKGRHLLERLTAHWQTTFRAIENLEAEVGVPLREILGKAVEALENKDFSARLHEAETELFNKGPEHAG